MQQSVKKLNLPLEEKKFNTLNYNMKRKGKDNEEEGMDEAAIIAATEKATFISMSNCYEYRKRIGDYLDTLPEEEQQDLLDEIGTILTCYKNDDSRMNRLTEAVSVEGTGGFFVRADTCEVPASFYKSNEKYHALYERRYGI